MPHNPQPCEIAWIDQNGNPTHHNEPTPSIGIAHYKGLDFKVDGRSFRSDPRSYHICAVHAARMAEPGMADLWSLEA